jgi:hypothetical protein
MARGFRSERPLPLHPQAQPKHKAMNPSSIDEQSEALLPATIFITFATAGDQKQAMFQHLGYTSAESLSAAIDPGTFMRLVRDKFMANCGPDHVIARIYETEPPMMEIILT